MLILCLLADINSHAMMIISHLCFTHSNQRWWTITVRPLCSSPWAFTVLMAVIALLLYIIFGTQQCEMQGLRRERHEYRFILDQAKKCQNPFLVIIVPVAPNDVMERNAIRNTWGNEKLVLEKHIVVLFLLGLPSGRNAKVQQARIKQENQRHQDLLQSGFIDSSKNATVKTMVMLKWLTERCPQAYYTAKVDPDILFNIRELLSMLLRPATPKQNFITGQLQHNNPEIKNQSSRFYIPPEVYSKPVFPSYPSGKCYIMSMDMPAKILKASREIEPILQDDMYIGLCLEWLRIAPIEPPNPAQFVFIPPLLYATIPNTLP